GIENGTVERRGNSLQFTGCSSDLTRSNDRMDRELDPARRQNLEQADPFRGSRWKVLRAPQTGRARLRPSREHLHRAVQRELRPPNAPLPHLEPASQSRPIHSRSTHRATSMNDVSARSRATTSPPAPAVWPSECTRPSLRSTI